MAELKDTIMKDIATDIVDELQKEIDFEDLVYTGQLRNSWGIKKEGENFVIGSQLIWAAVMDEGRLPGKMPPVKTLFPWVFQKIGGKDEEEIRRIAFLVAKKIAEKGIEPRHYVRRALFNIQEATKR